MKYIELVPIASNLIESTRSIGYSFETALADIIDNSISNNALRIDVKFNQGDNPYVAIIDNGLGMSKKELEEAMRYGSKSSLDKRSETDLGRFGLGLKMASMSQCRKLTVMSKSRDAISTATWDLDYINKTGKWLLIKYSEEDQKNMKFYDELMEKESGTIVIWEKLDRISESPIDFDKEFNEKLDFADSHLALVFHRYINNPLDKNNIELFFNNRKVEAIDPYMLSNTATQKLEKESIFIDETTIKIIPYIMPFISKLSLKERQFINNNKHLNLKSGLYIYRNKRLIVWGKWFRIISDNELNKLAKIQIDLPNNIDHYWKIDIKKSSAEIPSMIKENLKQIVKRSAGKSENVYKYRGRKDRDSLFEHIWDKVVDRESFQYVINKKSPFYEKLESTLDDEQSKMLDIFIKSIEVGFPYQQVYYDLAKEKEVKEDQLDSEAVYDMIKTAVDSEKSKQDKLNMINVFKNTDIMQKYLKTIELIEEELVNE